MTPPLTLTWGDWLFGALMVPVPLILGWITGFIALHRMLSEGKD